MQNFAVVAFVTVALAPLATAQGAPPVATIWQTDFAAARAAAAAQHKPLLLLFRCER